MAAVKKGMSKKVKVGLGIGAGLAAAAVAAYVLTGERGKKNRAKIKGWSAKLEKHASAEISKLKKTGVKEYQKVIAALAKKLPK